MHAGDIAEITSQTNTDTDGKSTRMYPAATSNSGGGIKITNKVSITVPHYKICWGYTPHPPPEVYTLASHNSQQLERY